MPVLTAPRQSIGGGRATFSDWDVVSGDAAIVLVPVVAMMLIEQLE